jgi:transposase
VPARDDRKRAKADALAEDGTLNPAPDKVGDPKFQEGGFFDPRDVVQVKYEMLRRVSVEKMSVTDVSNQYGVSRPTFYQAKADFDEAGIAGLVPQKRGPHGPHKIQSNVRAFLIAQLSPGEPIRARELAKLVQKEFGVDVHPRTIERAVRGKKLGRQNALATDLAFRRSSRGGGDGQNINPRTAGSGRGTVAGAEDVPSLRPSDAPALR